MYKKSSCFLAFVIIGITALLSSCTSEPADEPLPVIEHPTALSAPRNLSFDPATLSFTWDVVPYATGYQCAIGTIFNLTLNPTTVNSNHATVVNPARDTWETFWLQAVYSSGNYQITSDPVQIDYVITDKAILETPKDFVYDITSRSDDGLTIKITWKLIANADSYKVYTAKTTPDGVTSSQDRTLSVNEVVMTRVKVGCTILVSVVAQPVASSPDYISSRKGSAQIKEVK